MSDELPHSPMRAPHNRSLPMAKLLGNLNYALILGAGLLLIVIRKT